MTFVLGLTGSIGMGKSTTSAMFRELGIPVWDADAVVHQFYAPGGAAVGPLRAIIPQAIDSDGAVDRNYLRAAIAADPGLLDRINAAVHPLVAENRATFLAATAAPLVVLDIPLLYEGGGETICDAVAVVSVPPETQRQRVLERGMSEADFEMILARQMPDAEKRRRADYVIETIGLEHARSQVKDLVARLTGSKNA